MRSRIAVLEGDDDLEVVTTRPVHKRGRLRFERPRQNDLGGFLGAPWWVWVLTTAGGVALVAWWVSSHQEPDPEMEPVPPDTAGSPDVDLADVGGGFRLERAAASAFIQMRLAALADGVDLPISTAWRSLAYQTRLYEAYRAYLAGGPWAPMAAKPGPTAPHQRGIALDLSGVDASKSNFDAARRAWLDENCETYGWYNAGIKFVTREPWHYEYRGRAVS